MCSAPQWGVNLKASHSRQIERQITLVGRTGVSEERCSILVLIKNSAGNQVKQIEGHYLHYDWKFDRWLHPKRFLVTTDSNNFSDGWPTSSWPFDSSNRSTGNGESYQRIFGQQRIIFLPRPTDYFPEEIRFRSERLQPLTRAYEAIRKTWLLSDSAPQSGAGSIWCSTFIYKAESQKRISYDKPNYFEPEIGNCAINCWECTHELCSPR